MNINRDRENYFEAIVDAFDGETYVCSSQNIIEYVNKQALGEIGRDIVGQECYRAIYGLEDICPWCKEQEVFEGRTIRWEHKNMHTGRWYHYMASPVFHSDGSVSKLTLISDITRRKLAEQSLKESERQLQTLMGNLPGMVYRCRADELFSMEFASSGCFKLLGYGSDELLSNGGTLYGKIIDPQDRENLIRGVNAAMNDKRSYSFIYRVKKASGETIWVWEQGEGILSRRGELVALEGFITNVTEHKKAELDLRKENTRLRQLSQNRYKFGRIVGKSGQMQTVYESILKAASNDMNVIISGESGTGKELVAKSIHQLSDRKKHPFVTVNCGAINENLIESEFFGYKKGAFSGAVSDAIGFLEKSDKGTLFLDELGETSKRMQVKLLRAIESREFTPVGENEVRHSDFRIISATNRNLSESVKTNRMREDFYYRIHILPIHLPPLRERKEDIPLLIDHFVDVYPNKGAGKPTIPIDVRKAFEQYDWPGNIRELQNAVYRYIALGEVDLGNETVNIMAGYQSQALPQIDMAPDKGLNRIMAEYEKKVLGEALLKYQWNRGKAAQVLKIDRKTLYRKIKQLGLATAK